MSPWIRPTLLTFELMTFAVILAGTLGTLGAWAAFILSRGNKIHQRLNQVFLAIQLMIAASPMILHAVSWESTAGKFGLTMLTQTGARGVAGAPYGFFGGLLATGWIHGITGASIVCLATYLGTQRLPKNLMESGKLDRGENLLWWKIRLPLAKHWWITSLMATAMLAATEMTIADLYGFRTLADEFYLLYAANPSLDSVIRTCVLPLVLWVGGTLWWLTLRQRPIAILQLDHPEHIATSPLRHAAMPISRPAKSSQLIALAILFLMLALSVLVPAFSMIVKLGQEAQIMDGNLVTQWRLSLLTERIFEAPVTFRAEYFWTLVLSTFSGVIAILVSWPLAAWGRSSRAVRRSVDLLTLSVAIIPGPVIAMLVIECFQLSVPGFAVLYERSIIPTSCALMARGIPISYWIIRIGYSMIPSNIFASASLEMSSFSRLLQVDLPLLRTTLLQAWLITLLYASGDLPASLPVLPPGMTTVGSRLFGLLHSGARFQEAALAFWYLTAVALLGLILFVTITRPTKLSTRGVR
ncbi:MAG: hypothetical protein VX694_16310 [Planctomycetota bacterium]|nr:hypothetical protein [Planctomycetota bacterium]